MYMGADNDYSERKHSYGLLIVIILIICFVIYYDQNVGKWIICLKISYHE